MNETSFSSLEEVVFCFYQSNNIRQSEAQKFLMELENSPQVWEIIWNELLSSKHTEMQFYGATLLHAKLLKDWAEIPADQYDILKIKLLEAVVYFKDSSKVVLNRLCITLAVLIIRLTSSFWPNAVSNLISLFQDASLSQNVPNVSPETLTWLLLEILCVIPEEFQTILLSKNEKIFIRSSLEGDNLAVLALLEAALSNTNIEIQLQAIKCSKSWLEFGLPAESCDNLLNILINIVSVIYKNPDFSQCSINAIEAICTLCTHPNITKYPKKILYFLDRILLLADILNSSQEIPDNDIIPCLYTLFVNMGEIHLKVFIKTMTTKGPERESFLKLLYLILQCSNAPGCFPKDEIYSTQTFNFWYLLQDEIVTTEYLKNEEILGIIKTFYKKLILILMEKSMQPENMSDWSRDDKDKFRCYRQDIADTYMYCYAILNTELLDIIVRHLEIAIANPNIVSEWRKVDSYLYAFYAISENAICSEHPRILHCMLLLQKLPLSNMNVQVFQTVMELLGSYAEWLCLHPELLESVLSVIFTGIESPELAAPATLALKDIVRECKSVLTNYAEGIADRTKILLEKQHLKSSEEIRLIFSLGTVISLLPESAILKYLESVVTPYVARIQNILQKPPENQKKAENEISNCVGIFTQLFLGLSVQPPQPQFCLLRLLLPIFKDILTKYKGEKLVSSTCIAIKCAVSNLGFTCFELLPIIVDIIKTTYCNNLQNSLLELAKQLLILFGNNNNLDCTKLMSDMLKDICEFSLNKFTAATLENVSEYTSLLEHFYSFCTNVLKKNCKLLLHTEGIDHVLLFKYAGLALCAPEAVTVKSASSFLCNVINISREQSVLLAVVHDHGFELVKLILFAIGKVSPRNCLEHVSDVLVALSKKYCDWLSRWLNDVLSEEGVPSPRANSTAKKRFIKAILREKANKRRVQDCIKEFSFLCRGLLNKDYVEQTTSTL